MKRSIVIALAVCAALWVAGCSREKMGKLGKADDACYPGKAGVHIVELDQVELSDKDFHLNGAGETIPVRVYLVSDETEIASSNGDMIAGTRGARDLDPAVRWEINFNPDGQYQIVVEEQNPNGVAARYVFPPTARPGFWPVPANEGTFKFGRESSIHFVEKVQAAE
jgi:hypothetical protein